MASILKRWHLDVPDTRDWDLATEAKRIRRLINARSQTAAQHQIEDKILAQIKKHREDPPPSLPSVLEADYESILPRFGTAEFPVESAVLWALIMKEEQPISVHQNCFANLSQLSRRCFFNETRENSIRDILKTMARIHAQKQSPICDSSIVKCICEGGESDNKSLFEGFQYYRLDRPFDSRKSKRLFRWVLACIAAKLPVLFTAPLMNVPFTSSLELDDEASAMRGTVHPIGQHPFVGFDSVVCIENHESCDESFVHAFGSNKKTTRLIADSKLGIRSRNFIGDEIGCSNFTIIPEWYFHLGLVRDCWVVIKPNEKYLDEAN